MSPAHVQEPTYYRLKRGLMEGRWSQGAKLEAMRLADDFGVSMTPVRDCLNRLVGEGLVEFQPGYGYRAIRISETSLREMLDLNCRLLAFALASKGTAAPDKSRHSDQGSYADRVAVVFDWIASESNNAVLREIVNSLSDRLHIVRRVESQILDAVDEELSTIESLLRADSALLDRKLSDYHERRRERLANLVRMLG